MAVLQLVHNEKTIQCICSKDKGGNAFSKQSYRYRLSCLSTLKCSLAAKFSFKYNGYEGVALYFIA